MTSPPRHWQYIRRKAFDERPGDPDCDTTYVLWWHRHGPFKRAVLRQVVELVDYFSSDPHTASTEQRRPSQPIDASSTEEQPPSHSSDLRHSSDPAAAFAATAAAAAAAAAGTAAAVHAKGRGAGGGEAGLPCLKKLSPALTLPLNPNWHSFTLPCPSLPRPHPCPAHPMCQTPTPTPQPVAKRFGKWMTREEFQEDKQRASGSTQLYVSTSYPRALREDLLNAFGHHGRRPLTDEVQSLPGRVVVPLLCLYGRDVQHGKDDAVQKDFFEEPKLLALTQKYFEQRQASKRERQGDGAPTGNRPNLLEGSTEHRALRTITEHVRSKQKSKPRAATTPPVSEKRVHAEREAARKARVELDGADLAGQAVLLYSARFKFSYFMDRSYKKVHGFSEPIWGLWPQDVMLQRVAANEALKKLVCNELRPRSSSVPAGPAAVLPAAAPGPTAARPTVPGPTSVRV